MPTMKDVAKAAGVSIATVSATLSGASFVSPELQARVYAAIAALGYERNSMASGLKRGRSSLIGLIVSDVTNPFFTELVVHVQKHAQQAGYSVLLGISDHSQSAFYSGGLTVESLQRQHGVRVAVIRMNALEQPGLVRVDASFAGAAPAAGSNPP